MAASTGQVIVPAGTVGGARRRHRLAAQARFWVTVLLVLLAVLFWTRAGFAMPANTIAAGPLPLVLTLVAALAYAAVGLTLSLRRPEVRIGAIEGWLGIAIGSLAVAWAFLAMEGALAGGASSASSPSSAAAWVALAAAVGVTPSVAGLAVVLVLLYPNDRLLSPAWSRAIWVAVAGVALAALGRLLRAGPLTFVGDYENPLGLTALGVLPGLIQALGFVLLGIAAIAAGACVVLRYIHGDAVERAQLRIFAALSVFGTVTFVAFVITFFTPNLDRGARDLIVVLNLIVAALGPVALAVAVTRYRLWEIDHLVGRTFVYGALTAILAGVYAATVTLFQKVFAAVTGESSDAAVVVTTLILVTTFTPIKQRLEKVVERLTRDPHAPPAVPLDPAAARLLADPVFMAALEDRVAAALERARATGASQAGPASDHSVTSETRDRPQSPA